MTEIRSVGDSSALKSEGAPKGDEASVAAAVLVNELPSEEM